MFLSALTQIVIRTFTFFFYDCLQSFAFYKASFVRF